MHYKLVASAGSATAMVPPLLCISFNVAEIMAKIGEMLVFPRWLSLPKPKRKTEAEPINAKSKMREIMHYKLVAEHAEARSQSGKAVEDVVLLFEALQLC